MLGLKTCGTCASDVSTFELSCHHLFNEHSHAQTCNRFAELTNIFHALEQEVQTSSGDHDSNRREITRKALDSAARLLNITIRGNETDEAQIMYFIKQKLQGVFASVDRGKLIHYALHITDRLHADDLVDDEAAFIKVAELAAIYVRDLKLSKSAFEAAMDVIQEQADDLQEGQEEGQEGDQEEDQTNFKKAFRVERDLKLPDFFKRLK